MTENSPQSSEKHRVRIIIVVNQLSLGGTERHLLQILPRLQRVLQQEHFDVSVIVIKGGGRLEEAFREAGVPVTAPDPGLPNFMQRIWSSFQIVKIIFERPDILHFFLPEAYLIGGVLSALCRQPITIMSRRSLNDYQKRYPIAAKIEHWLHKRTTVLIGNSRAVCRQLLDEAEDASKIGLIYNGVDLDMVNQTVSRSTARKELNLAQDAVVLVIVANLIPYKGHEDLVKALHNIKHKMPQPWTLLCVGRDEGIGGGLEKRSNECGLRQNIQWLGELSDVSKYLAAADIGFLCSHEEGFSNSILEGMACSLPMIVTDVGGNAEAVIDGQTGIVVPTRSPSALGDAILKLALDDSLRATLGEAARNRVETTFSLETCVISYARLYRSLAKKDHSPVADILENETVK